MGRRQVEPQAGVLDPGDAPHVRLDARVVQVVGVGVDHAAEEETFLALELRAIRPCNRTSA